MKNVSFSSTSRFLTKVELFVTLEQENSQVHPLDENVEFQVRIDFSSFID